MSRPAVLSGAPLLIAHRGGAGLAPENTLAAFRSAADHWSADMMELDVRASADGRCVVIHDDTVDRTTDGAGPVAALSLAQLKHLDAGYRFSTDGATFPFRGRDVRIPTIEELFEALPAMCFTIEVKDGAAQAPLFDAIRRFDARERVIAAGMHDRDRTMFARFEGAVSGSAEEMKRYYTWHRMHLARWVRPRCDVVQVPEVWGERRVITPRMIHDLGRHDVPVHVWTVNDAPTMHRLLDWGVEGIVTDRPDVLAVVLHERSGRPLPPGGPRTTGG